MGHPAAGGLSLCPQVWLTAEIMELGGSTVGHARPEPLIRTNPLRAHHFTPIPTPKPAPPVPEVAIPRARINSAVALPISPSPVTSPVPTPSEPATANLSGGASPPSQEVTLFGQRQGPLFDRFRVSKRGPNRGGSPPDV